MYLKAPQKRSARLPSSSRLPLAPLPTLRLEIKHHSPPQRNLDPPPTIKHHSQPLFKRLVITVLKHAESLQDTDREVGRFS
jgi:hypothetical protein